MASVSLEAVSKTFKRGKQRIDALRDVALSAEDGELLVIVGPSGCGKTTTLRLIAGLESPDSGTIRIGDRNVNAVAPKDRDVAMVFQNYALYPHMTAFKNIAFPLKMRRVPRAEVQRKVQETAEMLGIAPLLDRKPGELSGGEQQRVALGRAIVRRPRVFLFDEPLSNLDATLRVRMRAELKALHRELQTTIIYVTHDQEEAMTLGDRVAVLNHGQVQQVAAPMTAYDAPANRFVAHFFGQPAMNFLEGRLTVDGGSAWFVGAGGRIPLGPSTTATHEKVTLGIRAHHVTLANGRQMGDSPSVAALGRATIELIEPLGDSFTVHTRNATGERVLAKMTAIDDLATGADVQVIINSSKAHLFSADGGGRCLP